MVDVDLLLEVLTGVGEVHAVEFGVRALAGEVSRRVDPHDGTAEADHEVLELRVAADGREVAGQVDGVVVPLLQGDDREVRTLVDDDLDVLDQLGRAGVAQHDQGGRVRRGVDQGVP
nr:hypothetical protein GCM10025699_53580 [Microbacterium flavescens]